jgi:hypothetical protein
MTYYLQDDPSNPTQPTGWYISSTEEKLNPQELSLAYQRNQKIASGKKVDFEGNVSTGLTFDLQRYTYSKFFFTLGLSASINRFLDIGISSHSENAEIFRYFQDTPFFGNDLEVPGEKNMFVDLINSFRFDDIELRRKSGFKLKSFRLDMVHHLGDWDATLGIQLSPEFIPSQFEYKFNTEISFAIQWKPIKEFKTSMNYDKDGFSYE